MTIYDPTALRRELHEMPELALNEKRTSAYVAEKLKALGIETHENVGGSTGVVGIIRGAEPGPVFMLRADMDALPFVIDGKPCCIHACGHDGHTAMLLAAASRLKDKIKRGTLKLLFQPAEETLQGAPVIIKAGVIDDVDYALGAHIRPIQDVPAGMLCAAVRHTASTTLNIVIKGRGAHASRPHLGINAIDAACALMNGIQAIWLDPKMSWSAKATQIHADSGATNTVPDLARITYDCRAQTNELMDDLLAQIRRVAAGTAAAYGAEAEVILRDQSPACLYDDDFVAEVAEAIKETAGPDKLAPDCGGGKTSITISLLVLKSRPPILAWVSEQRRDFMPPQCILTIRCCRSAWQFLKTLCFVISAERRFGRLDAPVPAQLSRNRHEKRPQFMFYLNCGL